VRVHPGGINVHPKTVSCVKSSKSGKGSDAPPAVVPAVPTSRNGLAPFFFVLFILLAEIVDINAECAISTHAAHSPSAYAVRVSNFDEGIVCLLTKKRA
jgi:hypothetical protein